MRKGSVVYYEAVKFLMKEDSNFVKEDSSLANRRVNASLGNLKSMHLSHLIAGKVSQLAQK